MSFSKYSATKIFTGFDFVENKVLIVNANGKIEAIVNKEVAGNDVQHFNGIISPGFINTHCHLELSHLVGKISKHTGLVEFIAKVVQQRNIAKEQIDQAILDADTAMYNNGIVAVGDICNTANTILQKHQSKIYYHNFVEVFGWMPSVADERLRQIVNLQTQFSKANLSSTIVPHAPYSISNNLWQLLAPVLMNNIVTIHNQETQAEEDLFRTGESDILKMYTRIGTHYNDFLPTQKSSLQSVFHHFQKSKQVLLVHNTLTAKEDIDFTKQFSISTYFCTCTNANLYIENALPPLPMFIENDCTITIGTDSLASNDSLSVWDEIKTIQQNFPQIPLQTMLQWATINGAKALEIDHQFGSFEKGKQPGIVLINNNQPKRIL